MLFFGYSAQALLIAICLQVTAIGTMSTGGFADGGIRAYGKIFLRLSLAKMNALGF